MDIQTFRISNSNNLTTGEYIMNPIHIRVSKTPNDKWGVTAQHPASHYMDGDEQVPIPSRLTWIGHDGQDMQYGTGVEFETEPEAKKWLNCQINEIKKRITDGQRLDINSYLIIHHDAIVHWGTYQYDSMLMDKPKPIQKNAETIHHDVEKYIKKEPVVEALQDEIGEVIMEPANTIEKKEQENEMIKHFNGTENLRTALFIKSYKPDFVWLKYCLRSIKKFCTGYHEVVIVVPNSDLEAAKEFVTDEKLIGIDEPPNGYLYQQVVKLNAHKYTECELIQYHDSDCIFITPTSPTDYMENGKPWMYCTPYEKVGDAIMWQGCVEKILGFKDDMERMRRHGMTYLRTSLLSIQDAHPNVNETIMQQPGRHFSEFNLMGSFVAKNEPNNYIWKNTDEQAIIPERMKQFHSYSEYTAATIEWLEGVLK